jgi:hypothetical protein
LAKVSRKEWDGKVGLEGVPYAAEGGRAVIVMGWPCWLNPPFPSSVGGPKQPAVDHIFGA